MPFKLVSAEGRTLRLTVEAGGAPCDGVRRVAVHETPATVTVTVITGWVGPGSHVKCGPGVAAMIGTLPVEAKLQDPLGQRKLIDGSA